MFEQELKKALQASRPVPPEGFDGRSDRQIAQLTRKEGIHVKKFSVLMIANEYSGSFPGWKEAI